MKSEDNHEQTAMQWQSMDDAPQDGTQILVEILTGYYQVVAWFDGNWRENTNQMGLRHPPKQWAAITPPRNTKGPRYE